MSFDENFAWQEERQDLARRLAVNALPRYSRWATAREDRMEGTDLVVVAHDEVRLGMRMRRLASAGAYRGQFTIRTRTTGGKESELPKIMEGLVDYLFYGIAADDDNPSAGFTEWHLGDLDVFRRWHSDAYGREISNPDGTAFVPYVIAHLPQGYVVASEGLGEHPPPPTFSTRANDNSVYVSASAKARRSGWRIPLPPHSVSGPSRCQACHQRNQHALHGVHLDGALRPCEPRDCEVCIEYRAVPG